MSHGKKNVLFMVADDLGKYLGCYGVKSVSTPHLDKFAAENVKFDMAYASTASCSGSRSTIYTGLHTHENGQYGLNYLRPLPYCPYSTNFHSRRMLFQMISMQTSTFGAFKHKLFETAAVLVTTCKSSSHRATTIALDPALSPSTASVSLSSAQTP